MLSITPNTDEGYELLQQGVITLAQIEANGMRVDRDYLVRAIEETSEKIRELKEQLRAHEVGRRWRRMFGSAMNFNARDQLGWVLYKPKEKGGLGLTRQASMKGGKHGTDESALEALGDIPFVKDYLRLQRFIKARSTYLKGIQRELDEHGFLHPVFNLHTTLTYRSSSDTPNFQNMPTRNPELGKLIRQCFIARDGHVIVENDFKGIEVGVAACYHKDPVMLKYLFDEAKDMHRDMAMQIYFLSVEDWKKMGALKQDKAVRHASKNQFVFPEFYGDWYMSCGRCLWEEIERRSFKGPDGESLKKHLKRKGIHGLGSTEKDEEGNYPEPRKGEFLHHIKSVENDFWNNRFKVYGKWKKTWWDEYQRKGYFDTYTGFRIGGVMTRNSVINYPVQGSAFHCLLWSLIQIQRELRKRKMRTKIVGQIHDSVVADVHIDELDEYLQIVNHVTSVRLKEHYKWIIAPMIIECEISPQGTTWYDKREVNVKDGVVSLKDGSYKGTARGLIEFWSKKQKPGNN